MLIILLVHTLFRPAAQRKWLISFIFYSFFFSFLISFFINRLSSTGAQTLSSILPTSNLKRLFIGGNLFNENDVKSLVSSLMRNSSLQIFSLGTETWLTNDIAEIVKKVMEQHNNLCVLYKGVRMPDTRTVDFSAILVDRCKFLAMKPKKPKLQRNMGDFFYKKLRDGPEYCLPAEFLILVQEFKAKLDDELVQQIADHWTVLVGKSKKVNVKELCNYYLARYPYELIEEPIKPEKVPAASADKEVVNKGKKKKKKWIKIFSFFSFLFCWLQDKLGYLISASRYIFCL